MGCLIVFQLLDFLYSNMLCGPGSILAEILDTYSLALIPSLLAVTTRAWVAFRDYPIFLLSPLVPTVMDCA